MSYAQRRLWFIDRLLPGTPAYNVPLAWRIQGEIDLVALRQALDVVTSRHAALRTTFDPGHGEPQQVVHDGVTHELVVTDIGPGSTETREARARQWAQDEANRPFDLVKGPVARFRLLRLGEADFLLVVVVHHIVFDGMSAGIFRHELTSAYTAAVTDTTPSLDKLPLSYGEYAAQQHTPEGQVAIQRGRDAWVKTLETTAPFLQLPTDYDRPPRPTLVGSAVPFSVDESTVKGLNRVRKGRRVTPFMLFLAAFQVLLARYTERDDIVVVSPMAGRHYPGTEHLIGFFINILPLRVDVGGNPSFLEVLDRVRQTALAAYDRATVPFEEVVHALHPQREPSWQPYAQVAFQLQHYESDPIQIPNATMTPFEVSLRDSKFDLSLEVVQGRGSLHGSFRYSTDLFEHGTIARLADNFSHLLAGIAADPECGIRQLPLVSDVERRLLLEDFNRPSWSPRGGASVPEHV